MPSNGEIIERNIFEFLRVQNWMLLAKENNEMTTYQAMYDHYLELKAILSSLGVNLTEIDKIKD